ncbi:MAG: phosphatase PAP2 family protein [Planctomycetota bacterium]
MTLGLPRIHGLRLEAPCVTGDALRAECKRSLMNPKVRDRVYFAGVAVCALTAAGFLGADPWLAERVIIAGEAWRESANAITHLCSVSRWGPLGLAIGLALLALRRETGREFLAWLALGLISAGVTAAIVQSLKFILGRARPSEAHEYGPGHFLLFHPHHDFHSFPSGHSADMAVLITTIWLAAPRFGAGKWGLLWLVCGLTLVATRVGTLSHWPSDVVVGAYLGGVVTLVLHAALLRRRITKLRLHGPVEPAPAGSRSTTTTA